MTANALDIEKFIQSVRSRPQLWNKLDPMYRNMELKNFLWKRVSQEMGGKAETSELKQKWHNLRDVFRRELRMANGNKNKKKKKKKWLYFDDMLFLSSNIGYDYKNTGTREKPEAGPEPEMVAPLTLKSETTKESTDPESGPSDPNDNVEEPLIHVLTHEDMEPRNCRSFTENDDYHFAMSIIPHMRQVPMDRKLRMRIKISEIIAEESKYNDFSS